MNWFYSIAVVAALTFPAVADEAGDLVFAERGPWDLDERELVWRLDLEGPATNGFLPVANGSVVLTEVTRDGEPALQLVESSNLGTRRLGLHPVDTGDPALLFFLERTSRDVAQLTGGSPFYIRNRLKDALFRGGELRSGDAVRLAVFRPFDDDPNSARMRGFDSLELTFTIGDPTQPIQSMVAETGGAQPGYRFAMVLQ